ncbi:nicotinate-nucleotide--dimethylbenzimidazole phosphoribosyltransferase [Thermicanus aegyptius]|uniref:nicotinate-nucleotide--dimethylbenzimidazole phosphoribosyltransferase n=1 Tax=Thermicanus aegyptius TaxID=94009 RepID=UPI000403E885|nr:nicotinate-nucleotide--dimethylbenzimidazole phosphoribosyltransferase [Thermicanus aegyptius]
MSTRSRIEGAIAQIPDLNREAMELVAAHLDQLTKPPGSLGKLEEIAIRLAGMTGMERPEFPDKRIIIMAADHGIAAEGVSAFPQEVTRQMVVNFLHGGAAINVISRQVGAQVICVDVGVAAELSLPGLVQKKIAFGTKNFLREQAMSEEEAVQAVWAGIEVAHWAADSGANLLATGEMGIGNTTASSALLAALTGLPVKEVIGAGTGVSQGRLRHKEHVIETALRLHQPDPQDPFDVLRKVGGLEIAALAGLIIGAAGRRIPVVVDGFISTVAALIAVRMAPKAKPFLLASHLSQEPGHAVALRHLGLDPIFQMEMRLGEGTGAALLFPVIDTVMHILREMATFASAGVAEKRNNE